jgi:G3E family GTPase
MVTVVDALNVLEGMCSGDELAELGMGADDEDDRTIASLLVEQIEFADVLVLNKVDLVDPEQLGEVRALLRRLNPRAQVLAVDHGRVELRQVLGTGRFDLDVAASSAGWMVELAADDLAGRTSETVEYGVSSVVWRADRPAHPQRFLEMIGDGLEGVVRSKGFVWLATRHDTMGLFSQAGLQVELEPIGPWLAAVDPEDWDLDDDERADLAQHWHPRWGDRRQELVLIGVDLDHDAVLAALDATLLHDDELELGPEGWRALHDPLPEWLDPADDPADADVGAQSWR